MLREIFGPMKDQVKEGLRKRRIEELNALLYSISITIPIQGLINTALCISFVHYVYNNMFRSTYTAIIR